MLKSGLGALSIHTGIINFHPVASLPSRRLSAPVLCQHLASSDTLYSKTWPLSRIAKGRSDFQAAALRIRRGLSVHAVSSEGGDSSIPVEVPKKLVFLGTPEVAAGVLGRLLDASSEGNAPFKVAAVVTQPPSSRGRGRRKDQLLPTPVAALAASRNFPDELIFTPETARDETFLESLAELQPDLCVTAAYGNVLPKKFLAIPKRGTVNIHPSLLPLYRGASPVQRALEDGVSETGVTVAFTVRAMDAGPIIAAETHSVDDEIKAGP